MTYLNPSVGQLERNTQNRVVALFQERLGYDYLGNWEDREGNHQENKAHILTDLRRYCSMDTYAMVRILEELGSSLNI